MANIKMKFIFMCMVLRTVSAAICDDPTEYEKNGVCCKFCKPGTYMSTVDCKKPVCTDCSINEFQAVYNKESSCQRQRYCDPNLNFEPRVPSSTERDVPCVCVQGFHCSTADCLTCVPHTLCSEGQGVLKSGSATSDTVCVPCASGTFSNTTSAEDQCTPWQSCPHGFFEKASGTNKSDRVCELNLTPYIVVAVVVPFIIVVIFLWLKMFHPRWIDCLKNMHNKKEQNAYKAQAEVLIHPLEHPMPQEDEDIANPAQVIAQPDEDMTQPEQVTDNNKPVAQEEGKRDHVAVPVYGAP